MATKKNKRSQIKTNPCPKLPSEAKRQSYTATAMTNWFSIGLLITTGLRTVLSSIFARFSDKRAILAASDQEDENITQWAAKGTVRIDYVADLGDGWDSTYSVAWCLAQPDLTVTNGNKKEKLPRGDILVMGGDQVYPFAGDEEYYQKLVKPYQAALPCSPEATAPTVFAIPGNHDWYDGLTGFMRRFGQGSWFGGWKTKQKRSYFAQKLPHGWWLWGVDTQLEAYLDAPQLNYFTHAAKLMKKGDRVILCVAEPSWIFAAEGNKTLQRNLNYLEEKIISAKGGEVAVTLAGDLHHFAHYKEQSRSDKSPRHKITCGGGGAFTHGTDKLPAKIELTESTGERQYALDGETLPSASTSKRMLLENLIFPIQHLSFATFVGVAYLFYAWAIADTGVLSLFRLIPLEMANIVSVLKLFLRHAFNNFGSIISLVILFGGVISFAKPDWRKPSIGRTVLKWAVGFVHGIAHVSVFALVLWSTAHWEAINLPPALPEWASVVRFNASVIILGGLFGSFIFGLYLITSYRAFGFHRTEAFSALENKNYKSFLRMVISKKELVIYPVGLRKTARQWRWLKNNSQYRSWIAPTSDVLKAELIGEPIRIPKN